MSDLVTRFAPSPTGYLHLGHAFSALTGHRLAQEASGRFLLRIEDIDQGRARPAFEQAIYDDLAWLGIAWEEPVRRQSEHFDLYEDAVAKLTAMGLTYPCFCTRADVMDAAVSEGPEGQFYPGTCKHLSDQERADRIGAGVAHALRIDLEAAIAMTGEQFTWREFESGDRTVSLLDPAHNVGDTVVARKDSVTSYHVSVVVDDALQGITLVTRGLDLYFATPFHLLLQKLLDLPQPNYHHHRLILDDDGKRLAKSAQSKAIRAWREAGNTQADIFREIGWAPVNT